MRNTRKLLAVAAATAFAVAGVAASTASAAVEVANPGAVTLQGDLDLRYGWGGPMHDCTVEVTGEVDSSGQLLANDIEFADSGWYGACGYGGYGYEVDDCGDAGWSGRLLASNDEGYTGAGEFEAVFDACWETVMAGSCQLGTLRIGVDTAPAQEWSLGQQPLFGGACGGAKVSGELNLTSDDLEITEVE